MEFLPKEIEEYAELFTKQESELLQALNRHTQTQVLRPRMISGFLQGRVLSMFSKMQKPKCILEIGTYTGYSALCLAEGLAPEGELHSIDINDELRPVQEEFINQSEYSNQIHLHTGNALEIIPKLTHTWDMVFIDADKENYAQYYQMVLPCMQKGGLIIADNVLWSGKVVDEEERIKDMETRELHAFNAMVMQDPRVENVLMPIRDELMIARVL
jgi:caffeoyl-CoA O-methyltransferase